MTPLVLASTSPYRRELLSRLLLPFDAVAPDYDESGGGSGGAAEIALNHALGKARSLAERFPGRIIIGSDQAAEVDGEILGKPGSVENALRQLAAMSGRTVAFHTGLAVIHEGGELSACEVFRVTLRKLTLTEIESYVLAEMPVDCAGSFKIEGLGIALMDKLCGDDYTSLIGLPLIKLTGMLREAGVDVLAAARGRGGRCG